MSKAWGNIGNWAAEAEREEEEEREKAAVMAASGGGDSQSFPSLKEAVNAKQKKKKMTLQEFNTQVGLGGGGGRRDSAFDYKGLTPDEMRRLPTGPKERSPEEMQYGRLGGGFSSYGRSDGRAGRMRDRDGDGDSSWGGGNRRSYGGFDDDRRSGPPPRAMEFDQPSRADEDDNWAMGKKPVSSFDSAGRANRYSSLGGGIGGDGMSRADEVDNWAAGKRPIPARSSTYGSTFRDSRPEPDRWTREGSREMDRERPRLVLNPPRGEGAVVEQVKSNKPNPFGAARPREDVLAEKGLDWRKQELEIDAKKSSRPTSSHSSRPSSAQSSRSEGLPLQGTEGVVKPRPKVNPFGDAKPREVLLEEKGKDWRKIDSDLERRRVDRPETEMEKNLKEEIDLLKMELEKESASGDKEKNLHESGDDKTSLRDQVLQKERDLDLLIRELDDKVRFGQKPIERPSSGSGRGAAFTERPSSRSGMSEESRSMEFMERPRSRGTGDVWTRQGEDRRAYQGGRERGFLGNREMDGSRSRDRW